MGGVALTPNYTAYKKQSQDTDTEVSDPSTVDLYFSDSCLQKIPSTPEASAVVKMRRL